VVESHDETMNKKRTHGGRWDLEKHRRGVLTGITIITYKGRAFKEGMRKIEN